MQESRRSHNAFLLHLQLTLAFVTPPREKAEKLHPSVFILPFCLSSIVVLLMSHVRPRAETSILSLWLCALADMLMCATIGQCYALKVGGMLTVYTQDNTDEQIKRLFTLPLNICLLYRNIFMQEDENKNNKPAETSCVTKALSVYLRQGRRKHLGLWGCGFILQHEGKVQVLGAVAHVVVSVLRRQWHVVEGEAAPQQAAQHTHSAGTLQLQTPRPCTQEMHTHDGLWQQQQQQRSYLEMIRRRLYYSNARGSQGIL